MTAWRMSGSVPATHLRRQIMPQKWRAPPSGGRIAIAVTAPPRLGIASSAKTMRKSSQLPVWVRSLPHWSQVTWVVRMFNALTKALCFQRKTVIVGAVLALAACQTPRAPEPVVRTVEVRVPTPVPCVPESTPQHQPSRASLPEEVGALIVALTQELIERRRYDDSAEVVIAACRRVGG